MTDNKVTKLLEDNRELFNFLLSSGMPREEAIREVSDLNREREEYLKAVEHISVKRELDVDLYIKHFGKYDINKQDEIDKILYGLGFDTKTYPIHVFKKLARGYNNKFEVKKFIIGQERLDDEWINTRDQDGDRVASRDAVDMNRDMKDPTRRAHFLQLFGRN